MVKGDARRHFGLIGAATLVALVIFALAQLVPYGHNHANPAVTREPAWDSPQTRELSVRACYDCHSNQTLWPWYSNVAPVSWLVQRDVDEGRAKLNFSRADVPQKEARESAKEVQEGEMPPRYYTLLHPSAQLTAAEQQSLIAGLEATLGTSGEGGRDGREGEDR